MLTGLTATLKSVGFQLDWSLWRRHHRAVARDSHYKRRAEQNP